MEKDKIIIVSGPTACGKTKTSIEVALAIKNQWGRQAEIINFDSLLFYQELSIGTAKPTLEERQGIPHHLIDICSAKSPLNAADYLRKAEILIEEKLKEHTIPILVGGSGFYLRALIKGMYETPETPEEIKKQVHERYEQEGISPFLELLKKHDPQSLKTLHENDHYRLLRAAEFFLTTGKPISEEKEKKAQENPYDFSRNAYPNCDFFHLYLDIPKEQHWALIEKRTRKMFEDGLLDEVKSLLSSGFDGNEKPLQSIGYKETVDFLQGKISNHEELIERIVISTRQLAKSQRTFFAKVTPKWTHNPLNTNEELMTELFIFLKF